MRTAWSLRVAALAWMGLILPAAQAETIEPLDRIEEFEFRMMIDPSQNVMEALLESVQRGEDFEAVDRQRFKARPASRPPGLIRARSDQLKEPVLQELRRLRAGEVSAQVRASPAGWFIVKKEASRWARKRPEESKARDNAQLKDKSH